MIIHPLHPFEDRRLFLFGIGLREEERKEGRAVEKEREREKGEI